MELKVTYSYQTNSLSKLMFVFNWCVSVW